MEQAKKVSIEGVKRPRGRPPLAETLKRRMKEDELSRSTTADAARPTLSAPNVDKPSTTPKAVVVPAPDPPASPEPPTPPVVKKRRKQGPRGMARLLVSRPGSKVNGSSSKLSAHNTAKLAPPKQQRETATEPPTIGKPQSPVVPEQPAAAEMTVDQLIPKLSSPIWQPASKRVLDAVCVTDVTACSGVTITVRESSIIDGFFRSRPE